MGDSEAEAGETLVWIQFSVEFGYLERKVALELYTEYEEVIAMLVDMSINADDGVLKQH